MLQLAGTVRSDSGDISGISDHLQQAVAEERAVKTPKGL